MCSSIVNVVFIIVLVVGTSMLLASFATPGWKEISGNTTLSTEANLNLNTISNLKTDVKLFKSKTKQAYGLISCDGSMDAETCKEWFKNKKDWEKAVIAFFVLALLACSLAFIWSCIVCFACCCKGCLTPPLPIFTGIATVCAIIAVAVYAAKSQKDWDKLLENAKKAAQDKNLPEEHYGYSFFLGVGACLVLAVDTIIGIVLVKCSKVAPI